LSAVWTRSTRPMRGQTFRAKISNLGSSAAAACGLIGFLRTQWGAYTLPLHLGFPGMTGCRLYTSIDAMVPLPINSGAAKWELPIPSLPELLGMRFDQQGLVFGASAFMKHGREEQMSLPGSRIRIGRNVDSGRRHDRRTMVMIVVDLRAQPGGLGCSSRWCFMNDAGKTEVYLLTTT